MPDNATLAENGSMACFYLIILCTFEKKYPFVFLLLPFSTENILCVSILRGLSFPLDNVGRNREKREAKEKMILDNYVALSEVPRVTQDK